MQSSVTVTIHHATSSQAVACADRGCGAHGVTDTASVSTASATRLMARVPAHQGTVGSSARNRVLLDSMVRTAGTGRRKKLRDQMYHFKHTGHMQFYRCLIMFRFLVCSTL